MEEIETDSPEYIRTTTGGLRAMSYIVVVSSHSSDGHDLRIPEANLIQRMVAIQPGPINELSKQVVNQLNQAITSYYSRLYHQTKTTQEARDTYYYYYHY